MSDFDKNKYKFSLLEPLSLAGEVVVKERGSQCNSMVDELILHNVLIKDLVSECPSIEIRNEILNIAYYLISDMECYEKIIEDKELPIIKIAKRIPISRSFLKLWQEYIIAYVIILGNPNYKYIQDYFRIEESVHILGDKALSIQKSIEVIKGIVISKSKKSAIVITSKGEFKKIKIKEYVDIGEEIRGEEYLGFKKYKIHVAIVATLVTLVVWFVSVEYTTVRKTIVINTTSLIKIEINSFNKVINAQSPTSKGTEMIEKIKIQDKEVDESLYKILKYVTENGMIPNSDMLVTVSGKEIDLETLKETNKFLEESKIPVKFNNLGNEHYINQ